jgi:hypothetical protein
MVAPLLILLVATASEPRLVAHARATATIVEGRRIHLSAQMIDAGSGGAPHVQRSRLQRRDEHGAPAEIRLLEFQ